MRERWSSKKIFILAAVGSAVGLGNVWRFPYLVGKYGGGSFLIPYLIMLLILGLPLLILELAIGEKMQRGAVKAFGKIKNRLSAIGYGALIAGFMIVSYYTVIIAWTIIYLIKSVTLEYAPDTQNYFFNEFLQVTPNISTLGSINIPILTALFVVWILIYLSVSKGVASLSKALKITVPLPFLLILILAIRGVTLPGAMEGLLFYLKPNFAAILDAGLWTAAIAQAFFSLSLASGIMIAYSSYESKKSDITKSSIVITFADFLIAFVAGFAVFGTLGYMASQQGVSVASLAAEGPGLAFIVFPQALIAIPGAVVLSMIFFFILVNLGISSAFSIVEAIAIPITDVVGEKHEGKVAFGLCSLGLLAGIIFTTGAGVYFIDLIDHFITTYPLLIVGFFECIAVGWIMGASKLRSYINQVSYWKLGKSWDIAIKYIAPLLILSLLVYSFVNDIINPYQGFPQWALNIGWGVVAGTVVLSLALAYLPGFLKKDAKKVLGKMFK